MRGPFVGFCLAGCVAAGCGGGSSSGSPGAPSAAASSIAVTLRDVVLVGANTPATATATLSNGQTQPVTTGWRSDAPAVATVTDAGSVTGVSNGRATLAVTFGGRDGTKNIRVAPNYDGRWQGMQVITACIATGAFVGFCEQEGVVAGVSLPVGLIARHPGELQVSGEFTVEGQPFPTFNSEVEADGAIRMAATLLLDGVQGEAEWRMNSTVNGRGAGTIREKYSLPGVVVGDLTFESNLSGFVRSGAAMAPSVAPSRGFLRSRIRAMRGR